MPPGKRFADPLTEKLAALARSIGQDAPLQLCAMSCAQRMSAENGVALFTHIRRWLR